jgi:hypothetical protein
VKIAKEVDAMMWDIANTGDFQAIENFKKQFPDLHGELSRRVLLLKDLRKAKSLQVAPVTRPAFVPKAKIRHYVSWPAVGLATLSLAVAATATVKTISSRSSGDGCCAESNGPHLVNTSIRHFPQKRLLRSPDDRPPRPHTIPVDSQKPTNFGSPATAMPPPMQGSLTKSDGAGEPVRLRVALKEASLSEVIHAISATFKLDIQTAPGLPNPSVDIDEQDTDGRGLLDRLGRKYGFGVISEGTNSVLLVPTQSSL